eukprot:2023774-Prymnesium_polylepis.2
MHAKQAVAGALRYVTSERPRRRLTVRAYASLAEARTHLSCSAPKISSPTPDDKVLPRGSTNSLLRLSLHERGIPQHPATTAQEQDACVPHPSPPRSKVDGHFSSGSLRE